MRIHIILSFLLSAIAENIVAQTVFADFTIASSACTQQSLEITNESSNANAYLWDFCLGDMVAFQDSQDIATISGISGASGYKLVNDNGQWFGFVVSEFNHKLFRLDFGSDPENIPIVSDLGNPNSMLRFPQGIEIVKNDGNWYGFIGFNDTNFGIVRLDFGNALTNQPVAQNLGTFGLTARFWDLKVVRENSNLILACINYAQNSIVRINFRNSFDNAILLGHIFDTGPLAGSSFTSGLDLVQNGTGWDAVVASYQNDKILHVKFSGSILDAHTLAASYAFSGVAKPYRIKLIQEGHFFFAAVTNETLPVQIIDFKDLDPLNSAEPIVHASLPPLIGIDVLRYKGKSLVQGGGFTNKFKQMTFESDCGAALSYSESISPEAISYSSSGLKNIELKAINTTSSEASIKSISVGVSGLVAPDIDFFSQNICAGADIIFASQNNSANITLHTWDFGDLTPTSSQLSPVHQYTNSGEFTVKLEVTADNGCINFASKNLKVYSKPIALFDLPTGLICTNNELIFENATIDNFDGNLAYQWYVEDEEVSTDADLTHSFTTSGVKSIKLKASIPGCSNEITQSTSTVQAGPVVDFSFAGKCEDKVVEFTSYIEETVTSYDWDFDDGTSSNSEDPDHIFNDMGTYSVTLTALSPSGCNNSKTKSVNIYTTPVVDFKIDPPPLSCSGSDTYFIDLTVDPVDSNIISWNWSFDDPGPQNTSSQQNPAHTFANAGAYDVSLSVTTDAGCSGSLQKQIQILPSPVVTVDNSAACKGLPVNFTPTGTAIQSYYWEIGTSYYEVANPIHTFNTPGNYEIYLLATGSNNCQRSVTKTINIPAPLVPDFSVSNNCIGYDAVFTDVTTGNDPVASRQWTIVGVDAGTTPAIAFPFTSTGNKEIRLRVTSAAGCSYTSIKNISVAPAPKAAFTATPETGAAPLTVSFINASTGTATYTWIFSESSGATSNQISPTYIFQELGEHNVELIARSNEGCEVRANKLITIEAPLPDVELKIITVSENADGSLKVIITIQNRGNTILENLPVHIDISGEVSLREIIEERILPSAMHNLVLSYGITQADLKFLCATAELENDLAPEGNRMCTELGESTFIFTAYPNPVKNQLNIEWINHKDRVVSIFLSDAFGRSIIKTEVVSTEGLNRQTFDVNALQTGIYFLVINDGFIRKTQRILVSSKN